MRVECEVRAIEIPNERTGQLQPGVEVTCGECGHSEQSFGESSASVRRCLALLREHCPEGTENYYVDESEG
jgi:ribosomal protein S27E